MAEPSRSQSSSSKAIPAPLSSSAKLPHRASLTPLNMTSPTLSPTTASATTPTHHHRGSFAESQRGIPPSSPLAASTGSLSSTRKPSVSQQALQELLNNPPTTKGQEDARFLGRDWRDVTVGEIVDGEGVRWVEEETSVEEATNLLVSSGPPHVVLVRSNPASLMATSTFDYSDLNAYLLLVVGLAHPDSSELASFDSLARKGREGQPIPLKDVKDLGKKEPLVFLPRSAQLTKAMEVFGSGVHRVLVTDEEGKAVVGVLTQLSLVRFFWENRRGFKGMDVLYAQTVKDLGIGSQKVFAINGDKPLASALELMNNEGVTSLPVLDATNNVIGNISHVDVRLLTKTTSLPLLRSSCIHFISVILSERGVNDGKDSFPVFHITPFSTLAHTVAKLVATRSHRMWIVDSPSPASSGPPTPASTPAVLVPPSPMAPLSSSGPATMASPTPTHLQGTVAPSISASAIPGASLSGHLSGVISLTDILNLFARASGLNPHDPDEARRARRRSSSSSMRRSMDSGRSESISGRRESVSDRDPRGLGGAGTRGRPGVPSA